MTRATEAAGCLYGFQAPIFTCWYAWAQPERPEFLEIIAQRVMDDSGGVALRHPRSLLRLKGHPQAASLPAYSPGAAGSGRAAAL